MGSEGGDLLVGRRVRKLFPGFGVFEGSITFFNSIKGFYKVEYEDGDREDMELPEVQQFLIHDGFEVFFSNVAPLGDQDHNPPAVFSCPPLSSTTDIHGAAALSAIGGGRPSDILHQIPVRNSLSLPSFDISSRGENASHLHCSVGLLRASQHLGSATRAATPLLPLPKDHSSQILQNKWSGKRKSKYECSAVESSLDQNLRTDVKKARMNENMLTVNATSPVVLTQMNQSVKDMEADEICYLKFAESHAISTNEKPEYVENVALYASSSQHLSHGHEDADSFSAFKEAHPYNCAPSAESSVGSESSLHSSNQDAAKLPPLEPLPPSSVDFLVPQDSILDFLETYSFLRSFSQALFLSPFSIESFQQGLCANTPTDLMDSVHLCLLQALRRNLERLAKGGFAFATDCLRQLDWTLLDGITWPLHLMAFLGMYGFEGTRDLKLAFSTVEYYKIAVKNKVAVLNFLCHHIMDTQEIRAEVATRELLYVGNIEEEPNGMPQLLEGKEFQQPDCTMEGAVKSETIKAGKQEVEEKNIDECTLCGMNGNLLCCDGCPAAYHARCVGVTRSALPQGDWFCPECVIDRLGKKQHNPIGLRGGDLLGVDPYGHNFIAACGYLLVIGSADGSKLQYYNSKDLPLVLDWLEKMKPWCDPVKSKVLYYWSLGRTLPESSVLGISPQEIILKSTQTYPRGETMEGFRGTVANEGRVTERYALAPPVLALRPMIGSTKLNLESDGLTSGCGLTETSRLNEMGLHRPLGDYVCSHHLVEARADNYSLNGSTGSDGGLQCSLYTNFYSLGDAAATAAANLAIQNAKRKARMTPINEQLEAFCRSSVQFCWPNVNKKLAEPSKEICGWCFCCSYPSAAKGCILNQAAGVLAAGAARWPGSVCPTNFGFGHLPAVAGYLLHMEDILKALLLGPWRDAGFRRLWRKEVEQAEHVNDLKLPLLQLESCLRPALLSGKWLNGQEDAPSLKCGSYLEDTAIPNRSCKKFQHKASAQTDGPDCVETLLLLQSWKNPKSFLQWYILPSHIARRAGRQGGLNKIQGLVYSEEQDVPRRSRRCAWQARVEAACTVSQLALQVRCLDAYVQWDDLHPPSMSVDTSKTDAGPKCATVYAKKWKGDVPVYLVDSEIVKRRKRTPKPVLTEDRVKVWVTDTQMPLLMLRKFEEKLWLEQQNTCCDATMSASLFKNYCTGRKRSLLINHKSRLALIHSQKKPLSVKICDKTVLASCNGHAQTHQDTLSASSIVMTSCKNNDTSHKFSNFNCVGEACEMSS